MVEDDLRKKMTVLQYQNIKEFCEFYTIEVEEINDHPDRKVSYSFGRIDRWLRSNGWFESRNLWYFRQL